MSAAKHCIGLVPQEFNFNQFEPTAEIVINQAGYYGIPRARARERAEICLKQSGAVGQAPGNGKRVVWRDEAAIDDRPRSGA